MPFPILTTKLHLPPARARLVSRPRLTARLAACLDCPVTLVTAPAGFGKTTLLTDWRTTAAGRALPVAWLALDPSDGEPVRFWRYVVAALKTIPALAARPGFAADTLAAFAAAPRPTVDQFLIPLLNDIAAATTPFVLVLDDYDQAAGPEINAAMALLFDRLPAGMRVVLLTRAEPDLPLGHLRARGQLGELRAPDLRFTLAEATAFLNETMAFGLTGDDVAALQRRTEGWIAALQMAAVSLAGHSDRDRRAFVAAFAGDHRHLADYFVEEVLAKQPEPVQAFLSQTAILERLSGPLCDAVTGGQGGQAMLERIERANLFLAPLDEERHWYRYHRLLADLLLARLRQAQPELVPTLHRRAAQWYEQAGLSLDAAGHALAAGDFAYVADICEHNAPGWWAGASHAYLDFMNRLPSAITEQRPSFCLYSGWLSTIRGQPEQATRLFDAAERRLADAGAGGTQPDAAAMLSFIALVRKYIAELRGQPYHITAADYRAVTLIPEDSVAMRNSADAVLAHVVQMEGDLDRAAPLLAAAAERDLRYHSTNAVPIAISRLARLRLVQGRLRDAEALLRQYIGAIVERGSRRYFVNGNLHAVLADVLREQNRLTEAAAEADEGVAANEAWVIPHAVTLSLHAKARVLAATGDTDAALALLDREEQFSLGRSLLSDLISDRHVLRVRLWLATGDVAAAERWVRDSGLTATDALSFRREAEHISLARVLLAAGRLSEAATLLARLATAAEHGGRQGRLLETLVLQAHAQAAADPHAALAALSRALAIAAPEGYIRVFLEEGAPVLDLLRRLAAAGGAGAAAAQRILAAAGPTAASAHHMPQLAEPLSAREREILALLAAGMSNREIAKQLMLTVGTVKTHVHSIFGKLDVDSRTRAIARARELGLL